MGLYAEVGLSISGACYYGRGVHLQVSEALLWRSFVHHPKRSLQKNGGHAYPDEVHHPYRSASSHFVTIILFFIFVNIVLPFVKKKQC